MLPFFSIPTFKGCCMFSFYQIAWPPKLTWIYPIKMPFQAYDHIPHCPKTSLGFCPPCCINLYFPRKPFCGIGCLGVQALMYLWRKVVCLFLFFSCLWDPPNWDALDCGCFRLCSWSLWKALNEQGCIGLVPWCLDVWCKSSWILNDFFHWKLNYLVRFGFRIQLILSHTYWFKSDFCHWKFE